MSHLQIEQALSHLPTCLLIAVNLWLFAILVVAAAAGVGMIVAGTIIHVRVGLRNRRKMGRANVKSRPTQNVL